MAAWGVAALSVTLWLMILVGSVGRTPGWEGWLGGLFRGFMVALLVMVVGMWGVVRLYGPRRAREVDPSPAPPIEASLAATLAELETVRAGAQAKIHARLIVRVPLGALAGAGAWLLTRLGDDPSDAGELVGFLATGALFGYGWAVRKLSDQYRALYKSRVLPALAAQFGQLHWRPAQPPIDELRRHRLFEAFDGVVAEDEIIGDYCGLPVSLIELRLTHGSGKNLRTVFYGLLASVTLPRGLSGTTIVTADKGSLGNLAERMRGGDLEQVRVEDPQFEKTYEVYGSDQVAARALLTPAFMSRFMDLARSGRFGAPQALVQDNRLLMALPATHHNLFEPPSWRQPATGREALRTLTEDLQTVLSAADSVIDLDFAARTAKAEG